MSDEESQAKMGLRPTILVIDEGGELTDESLRNRMPGKTLVQEDFSITTQTDTSSDIAVVFNSLRFDQRITARAGHFYKWDYEPILADRTARGFDRVYSFRTYPGRNSEVAPPILDWWINKSFDELATLETPKKRMDLSAIASTKTMIEGHQLRNKFIDALTKSSISVELFGQGRSRELADKWYGIAPFRYSIAIENSSVDHYWTEKISDCILSFTVPFYFGAPNISSYFPEGSYIWLPIDEPQRAIQLISETLDSDSWKARLPALIEARKRILGEYSLFGQMRRLAMQFRNSHYVPKPVTKTIRGKRARPGGWKRGGDLRANLSRSLRKL